MNLTRNYSSFDNIENTCWKVVYNCRCPPPSISVVCAAAAEKNARMAWCMEIFTFSVYSNGFLCFYRYIYSISFSPAIVTASECPNQSLSRFSLQKYLSKLNLELEKLCAECSAVLAVECVFMFRGSQQQSMIMEMGAMENSIYHIHALNGIGLDCIHI